MTRNCVRIAVLLWLSCLARISIAQNYGKCFHPIAPPDWKLTIATLDGFCFYFPPIYQPVRFNGRVLALAQQLRPQARLLFWLTNKPFKLAELASLTPTDEAPTPTELGDLTFYYSGTEAIGWDTQTITF